jgi:hypothetical protein
MNVLVPPCADAGEDAMADATPTRAITATERASRRIECVAVYPRNFSNDTTRSRRSPQASGETDWPKRNAMRPDPAAQR